MSSGASQGEPLEVVGAPNRPAGAAERGDASSVDIGDKPETVPFSPSEAPRVGAGSTGTLEEQGVE